MATDPYRLIGRIQQVAHGLRKSSDRLLIDAAGVTTSQAGILAVIQETPGCSQRDVARRLRLGEPAVVASVMRLQGADLIERRTSENDSRAVALYLTPQGIQTATRSQETFGKINDVVLEALGEEGRAQFAELLSALDRTFHPSTGSRDNADAHADQPNRTHAQSFPIVNPALNDLLPGSS
jgi:DNA-binding MarR family transcriptional regulator